MVNIHDTGKCIFVLRHYRVGTKPTCIRPIFSDEPLGKVPNGQGRLANLTGS